MTIIVAAAVGYWPNSYLQNVNMSERKAKCSQQGFDAFLTTQQSSSWALWATIELSKSTISK